MLMANKDQKKLSAAIFSSMDKKGKEELEMPPMEDGAPVDSSIAVESCAEDLIAALESKDPKSVVAAMKDLLSLLQEPEETSEIPAALPEQV